ncbi:hypothetical protein EPUL_002743 [Erysiphe pulchra]|uniref:Uncharacterized protein n=1 Tax=Erysiphe pulchra TaxID=225359 RepID=A0A2S4PWB3_9PEZI|nr:hypothetical protein EPUL_002743 [Erysiphe pulchra]
MTDLPKEEVIDVLGDLEKVTNATQFLNGVQNNPELALEKAYKKTSEQEQQLFTSSKELEAAKEGLRELEKSSETNIVLRKLTDYFGKITTSRSKVSSYSQWCGIQ